MHPLLIGGIVVMAVTAGFLFAHEISQRHQHNHYHYVHHEHHHHNSKKSKESDQDELNDTDEFTDPDHATLRKRKKRRGELLHESHTDMSMEMSEIDSTRPNLDAGPASQIIFDKEAVMEKRELWQNDLHQDSSSSSPSPTIVEEKVIKSEEAVNITSPIHQQRSRSTTVSSFSDINPNELTTDDEESLVTAPTLRSGSDSDDDWSEARINLR